MSGMLVQILSVLALSLGQFFLSFNTAWPSYVLELLESDQSPIGYKISKNEGSLISSLPMLGCFVGTVFTGLVGDFLGRKKATVLSGLFFVLSWSLIITASNVTTLLIGRISAGVGAGIHTVTAVSYVSEIGTDSTKGPLMSMMIFLYSFGTLSSYVCGWLLTYQVISYFKLTLSVLFVIFISFLKETPRFLISKGKKQEAIQALKFYRGTKELTPAILDELQYLQNQNGPKFNTNPDSEENELKPEKQKFGEDELIQVDNEQSAWKILSTSRATQRATVITCLNGVTMVLGGTIAVTSYAGPLFAMASPNISKHMCSIILSISFATGSLLSSVGSGLMKRRTQMMISATLTSGFLFILASLLRWSWGPEWMIPLVVLAYCFCFQVGVGTIPAVQMTELVEPKVKNLVTTLALCFISVCNFILLAAFAPAVKAFGLDSTFMMFGVLCVLICVYAFCGMPETKDRSIEEIMEFFESGYFDLRRK